MKLRLKNVLIVLRDDSIVKGAKLGEVVNSDGCEVEVCKHGVEFVAAEDLATYIARIEQDAAFEANLVEPINRELDAELYALEGELFEEWLDAAFPVEAAIDGWQNAAYADDEEVTPPDPTEEMEAADLEPYLVALYRIAVEAAHEGPTPTEEIPF